MTTILKRSNESPHREAASRALRAAGVGVVEVDDWNDAAAELAKCEAALVLCEGDLLDVDTSRITKAITSLSGNAASSAAISHDASRALSHALRTPLSAMAGWVHLMETGKLDEAGLQRALARLRGNIDDQVRIIESYLGTTTQEGRSR